MTESNRYLAAQVDRLLAFREARDWQQFHRPKELAAALAIESAELQELFLWRDPETAEAIKGDGGRVGRIKEEMADIGIFLLLLAHDLGIDLADAISDKISSNEQRYDISQHRGVAKKAKHHD